MDLRAFIIIIIFKFLIKNDNTKSLSTTKGQFHFQDYWFVGIFNTVCFKYFLTW